MDIPRNWNFKNESVASNFDRHVREQLPWYELATYIVKHYLRGLVPYQGMVYDLGCSTGNTEIECRDLIDDRELSWVGIDNSPDMLKKYRGVKDPCLSDISEYRYQSFDVAICFLCLMFLPKETRRMLLEVLRSRMNPHGAIILFDKFESPHGHIGLIQNKLAMAMKLEQGLDANEILAKEVSLVGTQIPMHRSELSEFTVTPVFKLGDFEGVLLTQPVI